MKTYPVKRMCAWCKLDMGLASFDSKYPDQVSHGMCQKCADKEMTEWKKPNGRLA